MDRRRFVEIAMGSAAELGCLLLLVEDLGLADPGPTQKVKQEANEIHKMLRGLWFSFKKE
jgi:four helix bundle protein